MTDVGARLEHALADRYRIERELAIPVGPENPPVEFPTNDFEMAVTAE
jgi:hypothetical protein